MQNYIQRRMQRSIVKKEGGEQTSNYIRKIALKRNVSVGMYSYGGCFKEDFNTGGKVIIGRYCSFGPNVHYFGANHPMNYASMSPYFYQKSWGGEVNDIMRSELIIGNDCWIGYGVIITSSCHRIGNGAVIGAGTILTKDVEPYSIVVGNPGKKIKMRFSSETIQLLEESRWFDLEPAELLTLYNLIESPKEFARKVF